MTDELFALLDNYNANTLREMAEANNLSTLDNFGKRLPKDQLLSRLREEFFTRERILASYQQLSQTERAVLNRLLLHDGRAPTRSFKREVIRAGLATEAAPPQNPKSHSPYGYNSRKQEGYTGNPARTNSTIFEDIIARLTWRGLVFSRTIDRPGSGHTYKLRFHPAAEIYIPQVIQQFFPAPTPVKDTTPELKPVKTLAVDPAEFLRDVYLYWDFVRRNEVDILAAGYVGKRALKAINTSLLMPDPLLDNARREDQTGRLYLLRQLLEALQLVRLEQGRLKPTLNNALEIPLFWQKSQAEQIDQMLAHWQKLSGFQDIIHDELKQYGGNLISARQAIVEALKRVPAHRWIEKEDFLERIRLKNPNFLFPERSYIEDARNQSYYYSRYSSTYFYGQPATMLSKFDQLETAVVETCFNGVLTLFGVTELGWVDPKPTYFNWSELRLTPLGQHLLKQTPLPASALHSGKLLVQPNFQVMAIGPVGLDTLARLDQFADREQVDRGAFQYRLSRESVYQAQQLGLSTAEIAKFLVEQAGQDSLPQNVQRSLDEWGSHHERIVFRQGVSLLQTANANLLNRLLSEPATANLLARAVAEDVALVASSKQGKLTDALLEQSLLPAVSGADPQAADQSVVVQTDGLIKPIHAVPSLHLRGRLDQLAEEEAEGQWRLTQSSVRRAGGSKRKVERVLAELQKLHRGKLPEQVTIMVKKWGSYYGRAAVETLTLLELSSREIMDELLHHPNLKNWLAPFPSTDRTLVVVAPDHLEQVKDELADLGIAVKDGLDTTVSN